MLLSYFSDVFPDGFPTQFSFISTYKMASKTRSETWDLVDVQDNRGETQFAVRLYGKGREIQVIYLNNYGKISIAKFNKKDVRNVSIDNLNKMLTDYKNADFFISVNDCIEMNMLFYRYKLCNLLTTIIIMYILFRNLHLE